MEKSSIMRLQVPYVEHSKKYFSFRLKSELKNEYAEYDMPSKILFLSDIEGNFISFRQILIKNHVIDNNHHWVFDNGHLVIIGDCFDRGEMVIECLWLIYSLEEKAKRHGGYVHFILGNHEIMNLNGDWRYIHPKYAKPDNVEKKVTALYDGNNTLWHWLLTKNLMEKIGNILVVHGGISPDMNKFSYSINEINRLVRPYYTSSYQQFTDPFLQLVLNSDQSPIWYRGYYNGDINENEVNKTLTHFGAKVIVTGHTIMGEVKTFFNGKVINVDTDHSNSNSEALLFKRGKYYKVDREGKFKKIEIDKQ